MRFRNAWIFYFLFIVTAFVFGARSAHAEVFWTNIYASAPGAGGGSIPNNYKTDALNVAHQMFFGSPTAATCTFVSSNAVQYIEDCVFNYNTFHFTYSFSSSCVSPEVLQADGSCAGPCSPPGDYAGEALTQAGYGSRPICAPDLCYYDVGNAITSGEAAEPPNIQTRSWLGEATGATCTVVDGAGVGGCSAGQADLGFGCMTFADNQAAFDAVNHLGAYVDPCIAAGTCTSLIDPCIGAGTCVGTGTGVGGTAGSGGTGVGGSTYVDPCIAAGTCTAAADPCIAAGTCTGSGTGTGGTAGGVNPCIAAGTCAGSGTGTGSGTGSATESTLRSVLDTLGGLGDFGTVGNVDLGTKTVNVAIAPVSVGSNGTCPEPSPMILHGQTYYFEWTTYCNFESGIKPILLVFAWLSAAGILIGGFKTA